MEIRNNGFPVHPLAMLVIEDYLHRIDFQSDPDRSRCRRNFLLVNTVGNGHSRMADEEAGGHTKNNAFKSHSGHFHTIIRPGQAENLARKNPSVRAVGKTRRQPSRGPG